MSSGDDDYGNPQRKADHERQAIDTIRDELARLTGWRRGNDVRVVGIEFWLDAEGEPSRDYTGFYRHPIDWSLDTLARLWEEHCKGWVWTRRYTFDGNELRWFAISSTLGITLHIPDTNNWLTDFASLTVKVLEKQKE